MDRWKKVANWLGIHPHTAWKHYARFVPADAEIERGAAEKAEAAPADVATRLAKIRDLLNEGLLMEEEAADRRHAIAEDI